MDGCGNIKKNLNKKTEETSQFYDNKIPLIKCVTVCVQVFSGSVTENHCQHDQRENQIPTTATTKKNLIIKHTHTS